MKVLHIVATGTRRGAEVFAGDLVRALEGDGLDQRVAILRGSKPPAVRFDAPVAVLSREDSPGRTGVDLRSLWRLRRILAHWAPDLIQAHGGEAFTYSALGALGRSVPIVYRRIGCAPRWLRRAPRRTAYGYLIRRAALVVALAEAVRRETISLFRFPPERVLFVPNAVALERIHPTRGRDEARSALGLAPDAEVLLSLAALTWEKDPFTHLEVARRVLTERPRAVHLIAGDGPLRTRLDGRVREMGLQGRVRLLGARSDVADLLAVSDILLFASRADGMEGMPTILIEAGMAGLPTVGYDVAGVSEVVEDGLTGALTAHGDLEGLATRVVELLGDDRTRTRMAGAAEARCRSLFDIRVVADRYRELYGEVAAR